MIDSVTVVTFKSVQLNSNNFHNNSNSHYHSFTIIPPNCFILLCILQQLLNRISSENSLILESRPRLTIQFINIQEIFNAGQHLCLLNLVQIRFGSFAAFSWHSVLAQKLYMTKILRCKFIFICNHRCTWRKILIHFRISNQLSNI